MAVFACRCGVYLTMRPPEWRDREYCFPHADDFNGCDLCGGLFCRKCALEVGERCAQCGGRLHPDKRFEPTGEWRLYPGIRRLDTVAERVAFVNRMYERGIIVQRERDYLLDVIAEQATQKTTDQ